jgi:outer membrane immunogenic protein
MKSVRLASVALAAMVAIGTASAADMPLKAPPLPPAPVATWTGFYIGLNGGYGWRDNARPVFTANDPYSALLLAGGLDIAAGPGGQPLVPPANRLRGALGGLQIGYNWQVNPYLLFGLEADLQASGIRGNGTAANLVAQPTLTATTPTEQNIRWFGTARARLGFLPASNWLIYGTGGFAYGRIDESVNVSTAGLGVGVITIASGFGSGCIAGGVNCLVGASSRIATGWTAGAGTEWLVSPNVTVKAEYLYVRLGGGDGFNVVATVPNANPLVALTSFRASWGTPDFHAVRVGINYKFNWGPAVAKY